MGQGSSVDVDIGFERATGDVVISRAKPDTIMPEHGFNMGYRVGVGELASASPVIIAFAAHRYDRKWLLRRAGSAGPDGANGAQSPDPMRHEAPRPQKPNTRPGNRAVQSAGVEPACLLSLKGAGKPATKLYRLAAWS